MRDRSGGSIAKLEFHAPYHPNVTLRIQDKYYSIDGACSNRQDKYVHWLTHFHFDHIRSSVAGGADFLLSQDEKIRIFAPADTTPLDECATVFEAHSRLYGYHSKGKRVLVPVEAGDKFSINGTVLEAVGLTHSVINNALFIKNKEVDFSVMITGDWLGSDEENREAILSREPSILVSESRYFIDEKYPMTSERMHTHVNDLIELKQLLPDTVVVAYHISRTFSNIGYISSICEKNDIVFGKKILFYDSYDNYDITHRF